MRSAPSGLHELTHVADVVGQREGAAIERHHPGVEPVGHVDVMVREQRAHRIAQQRGVVTGQRRHHQDDRIGPQLGIDVIAIAGAPEVLQPAKRLGEDHLLHHRHLSLVRVDGVDAELRFVVGLADPVEQLTTGSHGVGARQMRQPAPRLREQVSSGLGQVRGRRQKRTAVFMDLVEHALVLRPQRGSGSPGNKLRNLAAGRLGRHGVGHGSLRSPLPYGNGLLALGGWSN